MYAKPNILGMVNKYVFRDFMPLLKTWQQRDDGK